MKVVFLEEVEGTARTGDVKNVADGFARNYLLPRKLAAPATDHYITIAQAKATKEARKQSKLDEEAQKLVPQVEGKEITIEVRVGEQEKLFGSVTSRDIAEQVTALTRIELDHKQVDLKQPLREIGAHPVPIKLTRNVIATVTVHVQPLGGIAVEEAAAEETDAPAEAPAGAQSPAEAPAEPRPVAEAEAPAEETPEVADEPAEEEETPAEEA